MTGRDGAAAIREALRAAWSGVEPGPTVPALRPPPALESGPGARALPRWPDRGLGGVLDLALAGDPGRMVGGVRLRRVPSAGGRYPVDAWVDGAAYDPLAHACARVGAGPVRLLLALRPER
ncbi:hypothetical protein ACFQE5_19145, partial [Pseudonocardia hispaniensis]